MMYTICLFLRKNSFFLKRIWIENAVNNTKIFVVTEGEFVDKDQQVTIMSVDGNRVVVRSSINE